MDVTAAPKAHNVPSRNETHLCMLYPGDYVYKKKQRGSLRENVKPIFVAKQTPVIAKAIAFDLDETIGSFADLYSIWINMESSSHTQLNFNMLLELYPEFLRVGIFVMFRFIQKKIAKDECKPIYLYTNNQCEHPQWIDHILSYLEWKLGSSNLFARPVCAFKIQNRRIEPNRTTHEKIYKEFVKCTMLRATELCFVDDVSYAGMKHRRVYFIQPPAYMHGLSSAQIIRRFQSSSLYSLVTDKSKLIVQGQTPTNNKLQEEISAKMMYYIREFFLVSLRRGTTRKKAYGPNRFTRKKRTP